MGAGVAVWRERGPGRIARDPPPATSFSHVGGPTVRDIEAAAARIAPHVLRTPLRSLAINGLDACVKLESTQRTGSFKVRGAANRLLTLEHRARAAGVVTASSGNHGRAVAHVAHELGIPAVICVPRWVDPVKLEAIRDSGAEVHMKAGSYDEAVLVAYALADERGLTFMHPFDDPEVIAGQGTIGLELVADAPALDAVLIPLSGGGLCAGIAIAARTRSPTTKLIGVSAAAAPVLHRSLLAGRPVDVAEQPTLASALSGGLGERNDHTFALAAALLDEAWLVEEREIARAMTWAQEQLGERVEGGGAVALAPLLRPAPAQAMPSPDLANSAPHVAAIISGGNIDPATVERARQRANEGQ